MAGQRREQTGSNHPYHQHHPHQHQHHHHHHHHHHDNEGSNDQIIMKIITAIDNDKAYKETQPKKALFQREKKLPISFFVQLNNAMILSARNIYRILRCALLQTRF